MNTLKEIKALVDTFKVDTDPFYPPTSDVRWAGHIRIVRDGWMRIIAVTAEFATHWGDRLVVCEIVNPRSATQDDHLESVRQVKHKLAIEIMFFLEEQPYLKDPRRRGPFEVPIVVPAKHQQECREKQGVNGEGI